MRRRRKRARGRTRLTRKSVILFCAVCVAAGFSIVAALGGVSRLAILSATPQSQLAQAGADAKCGDGQGDANSIKQCPDEKELYKCKFPDKKKDDPKKGQQCLLGKPCKTSVNGRTISGTCVKPKCCRANPNEMTGKGDPGKGAAGGGEPKKGEEKKGEEKGGGGPPPKLPDIPPPPPPMPPPPIPPPPTPQSNPCPAVVVGATEAVKQTDPATGLPCPTYGAGDVGSAFATTSLATTTIEDLNATTTATTTPKNTTWFTSIIQRLTGTEEKTIPIQYIDPHLIYRYSPPTQIPASETGTTDITGRYFVGGSDSFAAQNSATYGTNPPQSQGLTGAIAQQYQSIVAGIQQLAKNVASLFSF